MKHRDKMNVLESPKSDETELVPISSNKINIQGRIFTKNGIFRFLMDPGFSGQKLFSKKIKTKVVFTRGNFLKKRLMKSTRLINDFCIFYGRYRWTENRNHFHLVRKIFKYEGLVGSSGANMELCRGPIKIAN